MAAVIAAAAAVCLYRRRRMAAPEPRNRGSTKRRGASEKEQEEVGEQGMREYIHNPLHSRSPPPTPSGAESPKVLKLSRSNSREKL